MAETSERPILQEILDHCPLCQGDTKIKAFVCPNCKKIVIFGEQEPYFVSGPTCCTSCGYRFTL
jgi:RNase P subunit RPR2